MNIILTKNYEELCEIAAERVVDIIKSKPNAVLGLPTGSTPLGLYNELIKKYRENEVSFEEISTFNLDEYEGLDKNNPNSYYRFMFDNFFKNIDINGKNINILNGISDNSDFECDEFESKIKRVGGIDLIILGLGVNGHIGFNEPSNFFSGNTFRVKLHKETIVANSRFFNSTDEVPKYALTMGVKTIMQCKKVMVLVSGTSKAEAIKKAIEGEITPQLPASILQLHKDVTIILDSDASHLLNNKL